MRLTDLENRLTQIARDNGAAASAVMDVRDIAFRPEFRDACVMNTCGKFGACWMCPPDVGDIHEMIKEAKQYDKAFVYQTIGLLDDSFDIEGMEAAAKVHNDLSGKLSREFATLLDNPLRLGAGSCQVCARCTKLDDQPCRYPDLAVTSLEAYGIAVSELAEACGLKYINGTNTVTYFGCFLFNI